MKCEMVRIFIFLSITLQSDLLNTHPLECSDAARRQLVSIVSYSQLSITVVAPAINLHKHKMILFMGFRFVPTRIFNTSCKAVTSPLSPRAMEDVCPHVMPTAALLCRQPVTLLGWSWLAVEPEPICPQLL